MSELKKFKISTPVGNIVIGKEIVTEAELRQFALQINNNEENADVWREKIEKDDISEVLEWLKGAGYLIDEIL